MHDPELELEDESEMEFQSDPFAGDSEGEMFGEGENAFGEGPLGEGPLGEGPYGESPYAEFGLGETQGEGFGDFEGEQFFGSAFRKIAGLVKKAAPMLKKVAGVAAPLVGTAIGGPLGGMIGSAAGNLLSREAEAEGFYEAENEGFYESENEAEMEAVMEGPLTEVHALGEYLATAATRAATDHEAEAHIGAATAIVLSRADLAALRSVLPNINRGIAVLTRVLRRRPGTRDGVRVIPTIIKRSAVSLRRQAASGRPVTKSDAARAVATQTRRVLGTPSVCAKAIQRNVQGTKAMARTNARKQQPQRFAF